MDCTGSLLSDDLGAFGGRSEVQIDGRNAYDPAAAGSLFVGQPLSQNLLGFPHAADARSLWDPTTGLISSRSTEPSVECSGSNEEKPTAGYVSEAYRLGRPTESGPSQPATAAGG